MSALTVLALACLAVQVVSQPCDPTNEFTCANGFCINKARRCNGIFECLDFSDEDNCPVAKCKPGEFQCVTGGCISGVLRCNGSPDCQDKSDESGCVKILCNGHSFIYNVVTRTCLSCQHNTQGRYCDQCKPGFYGNAKVGTRNDCKPCTCNGHSTKCDITGKCMQCGHNTEGEKCEKCRPGFRGDPTKGTPTDCKPGSGGGGGGPTKACNTCNGHSTTCDAAGNCVNCKGNTEGTKCEKCKKGFWGDPKGGRNCLPCNCFNHADDCEKTNGKCLKCKDNTQGFFCDQCLTGFTGNAKTGKCTAPNCAVLCYKHTATCNTATSKCTNCQHNTEGDRCEKCKTGFSGDPTKGTPTDCKSGAPNPLTNCKALCYGHSTTCDLPKKTCTNCQDNTEGPRCETCKPGFTGDATKGPCKSCSENCNKHSSTCDKKTGVCSNCQHYTEGNKCEKCKTGYVGNPTQGTATDCKPSAACNCNKHTTTCPNNVCKNCLHHTSGKYCERCDTGYYGKATAGTPNDCKKCPCGPRSTTCILKPGQTQPTCQGCIAGYSGNNCVQCDTANGYVPLKGGPTAGGCCAKKGATSCPVTVASQG